MLNRSVLAVFAHPDDAELACFGTLAALAQAGFEPHILTLTDGSGSSSPDAVFRVGEAKEAAGVIGADLVIEDFLDGGLELKRETYACVSDHLARVRPSLLLTHMVGAMDHQDHETAGRVATTMAERTPFVSMILQSEPPLMNRNFLPDTYVDITAFMDYKLDATSRYRSEQDKPFMAECAIRGRAAWWARQAEMQNLPTTRYYEAFRLVKAKLDFGLLAALGPAPQGRVGVA
jgi:LmbE family N-acetylglucosaminyl deacetylase